MQRREQSERRARVVIALERLPRTGHVAFLVFVGGLFLLAGARCARAALGDCGQPRAGGPVATDALEILSTAVGTSDCGGFDPCICDVNSAAGTTASDALIVLRVAVGENIPLVCPCPVTTSTTTTTTLPARVLTTEMFMVLRREGTYATSDLAGTWDVNALGAGNINGWTRGTLTVQSDGKFTGELEEDDGLHDNISGRLAISSDGAVTCPNGCGSSFGAALDSGKSVLVATMTPEQGNATLMVLTKRGASYSQANLTGTWPRHSLVSGPAEPEWRRGTVDIAAGGAVTGTVRDSDGVDHPVAHTWTLSSSGGIACSGSCDHELHGNLDSGKEVAALTGKRLDGSTYLMVSVKQGASYASPDFFGTWALSSLATGEAAPWWSRGTIEIDVGGAYSGTIRGSDGSQTPMSGIFTIDFDGIVTSTASPTFQCALDAGKTVAVCTESR
jgi:hypothetical protein